MTHVYLVFANNYVCAAIRYFDTADFMGAFTSRGKAESFLSNRRLVDSAEVVYTIEEHELDITK